MEFHVKEACEQQPVSGRRGMALVVVLAMLVILLGLAVTFLARARVERSAASSYAASAATRQLADVAVNLVQGQIRDATTLGNGVAWTSQPGMIRTFASSNLTADKTLHRVYKLYSASELVWWGEKLGRKPCRVDGFERTFAGCCGQ